MTKLERINQLEKDIMRGINRIFLAAFLFTIVPWGLFCWVIL